MKEKYKPERERPGEQEDSTKPGEGDDFVSYTTEY
jgi:hypothetical protein